jgi:hypothetical protein
MYRKIEQLPTPPDNFEFPSEGKLSPDNRWVIMANLIPWSEEDKKQALEDERIRNAIEGKFGQAKRRFSLNRVMAKLPSTSETAIAITFLVINLSTLLRQVFWAFLCLKWKNRTFSGSMMTISYSLEINQQLKLMLLAK